MNKTRLASLLCMLIPHMSMAESLMDRAAGTIQRTLQSTSSALEVVGTSLPTGDELRAATDQVANKAAGYVDAGSRGIWAVLPSQEQVTDAAKGVAASTGAMATTTREAITGSAAALADRLPTATQVREGAARVTDAINDGVEAAKQYLPDADRIQAAWAQTMLTAKNSAAALSMTLDKLVEEGQAAKVYIIDTSTGLWVEYAPSKKQVQDAAFTTFVYMPVVGGAVLVCTAAAYAAGPTLAVAAGMTCTFLALQVASALTLYAYGQLFDDKIDPTAMQVGEIVGATIGAVLGIRQAQGAVPQSVVRRQPSTYKDTVMRRTI